MSGWSGLQPNRFCVRTARPAGAPVSRATAVSLMACSFLRMRLVWRSSCTLRVRVGGRRGVRRGRQDGGERVLRPALAEPGEEGDDEQGQSPVGCGLVGGDRQVEE